MKSPRPRLDPDAPIVVIDVGNTRTSIAGWRLGQLLSPLSVATGNENEFATAYQAQIHALGDKGAAATVVSTVVPTAVEFVKCQVLARTNRDALVVGDALPLPMDIGVGDRTALGVDRVCAAAAAYDRIERGCTVVGFGTAITIDLVDDDGTFVGGAILPGIRMQLRALHEHTAQLPLVEPGFPEHAYGRDTREAIQTGVCRGIAGAVRGIIEGYATELNRWPQVVAAGGDAELMAPHCEFIDTFTTHLVLRGVGLAYRKHLLEAGA